MNSHAEPLVSVLTPVYNGEAFLAQCIESVLSQTYENFEYVIINNHSKDRTLEIAQDYAKKDKRIRIHTNDSLVDVISNHNIAFGLISPSSKYCKIVSADDYISPNCITQLVQCAEANPSVGIVGCYQLSGSYVRWQGFEYPKTVFTGKEICRRIFLKGDPEFGFGSPTSLLYRADLVRESKAYYPNPSPHSDTSACFRDLQRSDFGFVYEVLSFETTHAETQSTKSADMNRYSSAYLNDLIEYGRFYLNEAEFAKTLTANLEAYREFLGVNLFARSRGKEFWKYHEGRLEELGFPLKRSTLVWAALRKGARELMNPVGALRKVWRRFAPAPTNTERIIA